MDIVGDDRPRSMRDAGEPERRRGMLGRPHVAPLTTYAAKLREQGFVEVPEFDPLDGGVEAQVLFLFEKPCPMAAGSGFISRDNDDPAAEAIFRFMKQAGIARTLTVIWNVIPWWNYTRKVTAQELREGSDCVNELISLLPKLRAVVLVGKRAAKAARYLKTIECGLSSDHPGPLVRARYPERWNAIPLEWAKVLKCLDEQVR